MNGKLCFSCYSDIDETFSVRKLMKRDWVAFMSQPYWVEVVVEVQCDWNIEINNNWDWGCLEAEIEMRLIWGAGWEEVELKISWSWVGVELRLIWVEIELRFNYGQIYKLLCWGFPMTKKNYFRIDPRPLKKFTVGTVPK